METGLKKELLSLDVQELEEWMLSAGEAKFRAKQLFPALHKGLSPDEMTNLGKRLQEKLREHFVWHLPKVEEKLVSRLDGTVKYLFSLIDGNCVESVVMRYEHGNTICISSQVGCRMGCRFCASTIGGRVRDLTPAELLGQVISAQKDLGERISNIVMMGIGEPLDNYDNVMKFLHLVNAKDGLNIGYRHISLSTCGIVDKIERFSSDVEPVWIHWGKLFAFGCLDNIDPFWDLELSTLLEMLGIGLDEIDGNNVFNTAVVMHFVYSCIYWVIFWSLLSNKKCVFLVFLL